jgi:hypothetical protein
LLGELNQRSKDLVIDAVFGIVQEDAGSFRRHPFSARGIVRKECPQVAALHPLLVILERAPRRLFAG